jgi:hypothetical protein
MSEDTINPEGRCAEVHVSHQLEKDVWQKIHCFEGLTLREKEEKRGVDCKSPKGKSM